MLKITNHGPLIVWTNYWETDLARAGKVFASVNAGAIRVLLPPARYDDLADMRAGTHCVLSRGPWPEAGALQAVEIMWQDDTDSPYSMHLTPESFDLLPAKPEAGREWVLSVWTRKDGQPHKALERICHWRRAAKLPCLAPWEGDQA